MNGSKKPSGLEVIVYFLILLVTLILMGMRQLFEVLAYIKYVFKG